MTPACAIIHSMTTLLTAPPRYATGHAIPEHSMLIHEFYERQARRPVHLLVDTALTAARLATAAFVRSSLSMQHHCPSRACLQHPSGRARGLQPGRGIRARPRRRAHPPRRPRCACVLLERIDIGSDDFIAVSLMSGGVEQPDAIPVLSDLDVRHLFHTLFVHPMSVSKHARQHIDYVPQQIATSTEQLQTLVGTALQYVSRVVVRVSHCRPRTRSPCAEGRDRGRCRNRQVPPGHTGLGAQGARACIAAVCWRDPSLQIDVPQFEALFNNTVQDLLTVVYLANLTKTHVMLLDKLSHAL